MKHRIIDEEYIADYVFVNLKDFPKYKFYFADYNKEFKNLIELTNWINDNFNVSKYSISCMKLELSRRLFRTFI